MTGMIRYNFTATQWTNSANQMTMSDVNHQSWPKRIPRPKYGLVVEGPENAPISRIEWNGVWHRRVTRRGRYHYFRPET